MWEGVGGYRKEMDNKGKSAGAGELGKSTLQTAARTGIERGRAAVNVATALPVV